MGLAVRESRSAGSGDRQPFLILSGILLVLVVTVCPGPFAFAAFIGGLGVWYMFLPARLSFELEGPTSAIAVAIYAFCVLCAALATSVSTRGQRRQQDLHRLAAQQRESLRVTMESIGDAVVTTDYEGRIEYLNDVAVQLTGWPLADAVGRTLDDVFHIISEETRHRLESPVGKVLKFGRAVGLANHTLLVARDGSERPIDDSAAPMRDARRRHRRRGAGVPRRDCTTPRGSRGLRAANASLRTSSTMPPSACTGSTPADASCARQPRGTGDARYSADEYIGRHIADFPPTGRDRSLLHRLQAGQEVRDFPARMRRKDGRLIDVLVSSNAYTEKGEFLHTRCFTVDVTDRNRAEEALRASRQALARSRSAFPPHGRCQPDRRGLRR